MKRIIILTLALLLAVTPISSQTGNTINLNIVCQANQSLWGFPCAGNEHPTFTYAYYVQNSTIKWQVKLYLNDGRAVKGFSGNLSALNPQPVNTMLTQLATQIQTEVNLNQKLKTTPQLFTGSGGIT